VLINGSWGLGENIVQGAVNPDEWCVFKPTLAKGKSPIIRKRLGSKQWRMVYATGKSKKVKNIECPTELSQAYCLEDEDVLQLARWAVAIEAHYTAHHEKPTPMDLEWAKDDQGGPFTEFLFESVTFSIILHARWYLHRPSSARDRA